MMVKNGLYDPFGSMGNMMGQFQNFMNNPMQYMIQNRLNIPQGLMNNPQEAIQYLMNNGQMTQAQYNQLQSMAKQIQQSPQFMRMFNK